MAPRIGAREAFSLPMVAVADASRGPLSRIIPGGGLASDDGEHRVELLRHAACS